MTDTESLTLIHAELDGELDGSQRAALARALLAGTEIRALRGQLQDLSGRLDAIGQVEPPAALREGILKRLPPATAPSQRRASPARWRLAALVAGVVTAGTVVYETVQGPAGGSNETAGTMASGATAAVDTVRLESGPVTGSVALYREAAGLAIALEIVAGKPVDVEVRSGRDSFRFNDLTGMSSATAAVGAARPAVLLPGVAPRGQNIELTFLMEGHPVGHATLHAPVSP